MLCLCYGVNPQTSNPIKGYNNKLLFRGKPLRNKMLFESWEMKGRNQKLKLGEEKLWCPDIRSVKNKSDKRSLFKLLMSYAKKNQTIIVWCLFKCVLPLQFGCSWATSLFLITCETHVWCITVKPTLDRVSSPAKVAHQFLFIEMKSLILNLKILNNNPNTNTLH